MSKEDRKALFFGLFLCIGIVGFLAVTLFVPKNRGDGKKEVRVAFTYLNGVSKGMNVCLAGKVIGSVSSVQNIMEQKVRGETGDLYCYELRLKIDSNISLYKDDMFAMYSPKVIGESIINIIPGKERQDLVQEGELIQGTNLDPIEKLIQFVDRADKMCSRLETESLRVCAEISALLDMEKERSLVRQTCSAIESINSAADKLSECLDSQYVKRVDDLVKECKDIASSIKDYGILYQYSSQWKKHQKVKNRQDKVVEDKVLLGNK